MADSSVFDLISRGVSLHEFASIDPHLLSQCDKNKQTVLHAAVRANRLDLAEYILEREPIVNHGNIKSITPLHYAASNGNRDMILLLQRFGARQLPTKYRHDLPIHCAIAAKHAHILDLLADAIHESSASGTPLQMAMRYSALKGSLACVEALIRLGANIHLID